MFPPVSRNALIPALLCLSLFSGPSTAADRADMAVGKQIAMSGNGKGATACQSCHGANGAGVAAANFPRLAGLNADYLAKQLHDFASGTRSNPIMDPIAKSLTPEEAADVAAYYANEKAPHSAPAADEGLLGKGRRLVELGDWGKAVPACIMCHGPGANGVGTHFPALAGQHAGYIASQLNAWKQGTRKNDPNRLMTGIAERLDPDQIKAVSAYLAGMQPAAH